ncbi:MAG TPA: transcriptional regulator [Gammaproteobacteria bacterium]
MEAAATLSNPTTNSAVRSRTAAGTPVRSLIELYQPRILRLGVLLSYLAVSLLLYLGWTSRAEHILTAESGLGYALGIAGGSMMLLLLLYPLRKKARFMRRLGPVKYWFRLHMTFGVLGPLCILYHCDFQLGSMNSNVALFCMLTVAGSGLIGRYLYMNIHHGLYGSKATLDELRRDAATLKQELTERIEFAPRLLERLDAFECRALDGSGNLLIRGLRNLFLGFSVWRQRIALRQYIRAEIHRHAETGALSPAELRTLRRSLHLHVSARLESVRKVAGLGLYERLFSAWHILHFPLFLMLVLSGIVHVFAVHIY